jgi:hypothetical protein
MWRYTTTQPDGDWTKPGYTDSAWRLGKSGFGTPETPGSCVGTTWDTSDIWLRREINIPNNELKNAELWVHHDDDVQIYVNGVLAVQKAGWTTSYDAVPLNGAAREALKAGSNLIAIHCRQTGGGQYVDLGVVDIKDN